LREVEIFSSFNRIDCFEYQTNIKKKIFFDKGTSSRTFSHIYSGFLKTSTENAKEET